MRIPITEDKKHKYIKVRARAKSLCGACSQWEEKQFYISCKFEKPIIFQKGAFKNHIEIENKEKCQDVYYSVQPIPCAPDFSISEIKTLLENGGIKLNITKKSTELNLYIKLKCRISGQEMTLSHKLENVLPVNVYSYGGKGLLVGDKVLGILPYNKANYTIGNNSYGIGNDEILIGKKE